MCLPSRRTNSVSLTKLCVSTRPRCGVGSGRARRQHEQWRVGLSGHIRNLHHRHVVDGPLPLQLPSIRAHAAAHDALASAAPCHSPNAESRFVQVEYLARVYDPPLGTQSSDAREMGSDVDHIPRLGALVLQVHY
eukprot:IDg23677t1